ncbi:UNVERIFIED_ORG: hypothetical protein ABIB52_002182 [Arthrobacter sp. UYCu721]
MLFRAMGPLAWAMALAASAWSAGRSGGPPVITKTRDIDGGVARWHERRAAHAQDALPEPERQRSWWQRLWHAST